ncbi:MAG: hypothetical protein SGI88_05210 [Candidatus Hydrogenedentes bacterium]|nr:hypothetical protein [Candidatus Hydrogenedentota bacterium]
MRSTLIFLWEQWRQTAKGLGIVLGTLVLYALLVALFHDLVMYIFALNHTLVVGAAYLPAIGAAVLLFVQEARGRIDFAYPRRMLVLPAHTFVLVAAPLIYRLAVIAFFATLTGWICDAFVRDVFLIGPQVWLLMSLVAAAHAFVFLVCGFGTGTGAAIFVATLVAATPGFAYLFGAIQSHLALPSPMSPDSTVPDLGSGGAPMAMLLLPYWFVVAYVGARQARSEVPEDRVGRIVRIAQRVTYFDRERTEFRSPEEAQRWLEWRRGAYLFPWVALALGILLTFSFGVVPGEAGNRFTLSFYLLAVAPAVVASLVGYSVTRTGSEYQWFVGARPLTTALIARARLRAGLKAMVWAYILLGVVFVIIFKIKFPHDAILASLVQDLRVITSTSGPFAEGVLLLAFLGASTVLGVWALFWLARVSGFFVWLAGFMVAAWRFYTGGLYVMDPQTGNFTTPMEVFVNTMAVLMGIAGFAAIFIAAYRGYIGPIKLGVAILSWIGLVLLALNFESAIDFGGPVFILAALLMLPAAPLATVPLALEWQRHR